MAQTVSTTGTLPPNTAAPCAIAYPTNNATKFLRTSETTKVRQVAFFRGKAGTTQESHTERMKQAIDSEEG
jgi:hypothetical protein